MNVEKNPTTTVSVNYIDHDSKPCPTNSLVFLIQSDSPEKHTYITKYPSDNHSIIAGFTNGDRPQIFSYEFYTHGLHTLNRRQLQHAKFSTDICPQDVKATVRPIYTGGYVRLTAMFLEMHGINISTCLPGSYLYWSWNKYSRYNGYTLHVLDFPHICNLLIGKIESNFQGMCVVYLLLSKELYDANIDIIPDDGDDA